MRLRHTKLTAANLSTDNPARVTAKAAIVAEVDRLHWRIWNGKAKNAQRSLKAPLIFYSTSNKVLNTGSVLMSSLYFAISGASLWAGMLGIRS